MIDTIYGGFALETVLSNDFVCLGTGWRHSFETALLIKEDEVQLYLPDGKKFTYSKKKDGTYFSDKTRDRLINFFVQKNFVFKSDKVVSTDASMFRKLLADNMDSSDAKIDELGDELMDAIPVMLKSKL